MYKTVIRPTLFLLSPEKIHSIIVVTLKALHAFFLSRWIIRLIFKQSNPKLIKNVMGLSFDNPVGLAAGFDKDAELIDALDDFGFGFIEIGTVTPKSQPGNTKPRLFRLKSDKALINRMGFNNLGVEGAIKNLKKRKSKILIGGNIGKNKITPNEKAVDDYIICLNELYPYVDYFVVNVSSPNTPDLRALQAKEPLTHLLNSLKKEMIQKPSPKPILLKIAPDLSSDELDDIIEILNSLKLDGIIATNTTIERSGLKCTKEKLTEIGNGGLSGGPLTDKSTEIIRYLRANLNNDIPIIGVGGIMKPQDAIEKIKAGASLVQIYTGYIYEGPGIIKEINKAIIKAGVLD